MKKKNPPFVMITNQVLDSPAWRAMSHGARSLYLALKRRYSHNFHNNGKIYLSTRMARKELGALRPLRNRTLVPGAPVLRIHRDDEARLSRRRWQG